MKANKVFFDLYSTSGGKIPYEEYKAWYEKNDIVYIVLVDEKIYTKVKRQEMFDKCLNHGCFLEHLAFETPEEVRSEALEFVKRLGASYVSVDEFIEIEHKQQSKRVASAFAFAEEMISRG